MALPVRESIVATSFTLQHDFLNIPLELFEAHLNDPELNRRLKDGLGFDERKLIESHEHKDRIEWVFLVKKHGDMPKVLQKVLKDQSLAWLESSRFMPKEHCIYWEIKPESSIVKFHGQGAFKLYKKGKGCSRVIDGEIVVDVPLVGKIIENFIVNELIKSYEIEPRIQSEFYQSVMDMG